MGAKTSFIYYEPIEGEILKPHPEFGEYYLVSDLGRIISRERSFKSSYGHTRTKKAQVLRTNINWKGYHAVKLQINGKKYNRMVSRLVAQTFIPNPENKPEVNHKFGNKNDNRASQLEWNTGSENVQHAKDTGLDPQKGETHWKTHLSNEEVLQIFNSSETAHTLSDKFNIAPTTVASIKTGAHWSHVTNKMYKKKWEKLSKQSVVEIFFSKERCVDLAKKYNITREHAGRIRRGIANKEITKTLSHA